jgi:putative ABC transport system permease protein
MTVGLLCSLWGTSDSLQSAKTSEALAQIRATDFVIAPSGAPGLNQQVVDRVKAVKGIDVTVTTPTTVYTIQDDIALVPYTARIADRLDLLRLPLLSGRATDLDPSSVIVDETWNRAVGEQATLWLADGRPVTLRVAAVMKTSTTGNGVILTTHHAGIALPDAMYVKLRPESDPATVAAALTAATRALPATAVPTERWTTVAATHNADQARLALLVIGGAAVLYTGIAVANTLVMSTRRRARELALLRLTGATSGQVLRMVAGEALLVAVIGVLLAAGAVALSLGGLWVALRQLVDGTPMVIPVLPFVAAAGVCAIIAVLAAVLPAWLTLRSPAIRLVASVE